MNSNVSQIKVGVILSYTSRIVTIIIGLLYTPIMIRLLGQAEYGLYNIAASTISYLGVLNFGFGSAYMRFYSRYKVEADRIKVSALNGMFISLFSSLGVLVVLAGIVLAFNVELLFGPSLSLKELQTGRVLILILVVNLAISFIAIVFNVYLQANEKFIFQNLILILRQVTTPLITLPILISGYGSVGFVMAMVTVNIIIEIIIIWYCIKKMNMSFIFNGFDRELMREITVFSSYIFINMIVDQVNNNIDKTLLGRYQGTISVAIYSIASNLRSYYEQLSTTLAGVFTPRIHRMVASNVGDFKLTELFTRIGRIQFILLSLIMSGFIFFGRPFIGMWAGEDYYESYVISLILMVPMTVPLIQTIGIEIQRAKNLHQFRSWVYLFIAIGNVALSIPLSQNYGATGAAIGTAIALIIGNGFAINWYNHKKVGIDMVYFWKNILNFTPAILIPTIYGVAIYSIVDLYNIKNFIVHGIIYLLIYMTSMWYWGMNDYEKSLANGLLKNQDKGD